MNTTITLATIPADPALHNLQLSGRPSVIGYAICSPLLGTRNQKLWL